MRKRMGSVIVILLCTASCSDLSVDLDTSPVEEIQLAVFRYQFHDNGSGYVNRGKIDSAAGFFGIAIADVDTASRFKKPYNYRNVPESMRNALRPAAIPVRNFSECVCVWDSTKILDAPGGTRGILIWAGPVRLKSLLNAEAEGGYYHGGRNAEGDIFYLSRQSGYWKVDSLKYRWVS